MKCGRVKVREEVMCCAIGEVGSGMKRGGEMCVRMVVRVVSRRMRVRWRCERS